MGREMDREPLGLYVFEPGGHRYVTYKEYMRPAFYLSQLERLGSELVPVRISNAEHVVSSQLEDDASVLFKLCTDINELISEYLIKLFQVIVKEVKPGMIPFVENFILWKRNEQCTMQ